MADQVLHMGVRGVTDLMVMPGLINLDFADIRTVMSEMGKAMMGTGEAEGERRAIEAAEAAISNPLLDDVSMKGARGVLINITGGLDMTLYEVDAAANRIREEVDANANIIFGSTFDDSLQGRMRVSVVSTGIDLPQAGTGTVHAGVPEAQPEQPRLGLGQFRFQVQRPQAVPFPAQAKPAARRPAEVSPAVHLRAASGGHERADVEPAPEQAAAVSTAGHQPRAATPLPGALPEFSGFRAVVARNEERSPNLFARVKEFAFTRTAADRPAERHPPRLPDRDPRPLADAPASLSGATDEISDIPSFLRRERVDG
jgi:cell division protein FtsZ